MALVDKDVSDDLQDFDRGSTASVLVRLAGLRFGVEEDAGGEEAEF